MGADEVYASQRSAIGDLMQALKKQRLQMSEYFMRSLREQVQAELVPRAAAPRAVPAIARAAVLVAPQSLALVDEDKVALDVELEAPVWFVAPPWALPVVDEDDEEATVPTRVTRPRTEAPDGSVTVTRSPTPTIEASETSRLTVASRSTEDVVTGVDDGETASPTSPASAIRTADGANTTRLAGTTPSAVRPSAVSQFSTPVVRSESHVLSIVIEAGA